ncbi:MAG: POTRA domain-containing protein [Bacteroidota bacterium]
MSRIPRFVWAVIGVVFAVPAVAQVPQYRISDGEVELPWVYRVAPLDSLDSVVSDVLRLEREAGYLQARIDSVAVDSTDAPERVHIVLNRGARTVVSRLRLTGTTLFDPQELAIEFDTKPGQPLVQRVLEGDLDRLLRRYERAGRVLAKAQIARIDVDSLGLDVRVRIDEGQVLELAGLDLVGGRRTSEGYAARVAGLQPGKPLLRYDPDEIQRRLAETGVFRNVESVALDLDEERKAIVRIAVEEEAPGTFDVVLGYVPDPRPDRSGTVVGNVNVVLKHVLGAGRSFGFLFNRLPGQVTKLDVQASDPYVLGWPVRISGSFNGLQQDSTFNSRRFGLEAGVRVFDHLETFVSLSQEQTEPVAEQGSRVPPSDAFFAGVGFAYRRLDQLVNPRRGGTLISRLEEGRKQRRVERDGELIEELVRQQRLSVVGRLYVPVRRRHVAVLGVDGYVLQSGAYDESDLFRLGGATSLRGYVEEQFLGNVAGRVIGEWRYILDRTSYLFAFTDIGYLRRPSTDLSGITPTIVQREVLPGYGIGMQFGTGAGLFTLSLAFNPDEGLGSKVHAGLSLGL